MKKIGILSFHGAHNYGSMLQNFALQQTIKSISPCLDPVTINLRNETQDDMYNIFKPFKKYHDKRRFLFKIAMYPWRSKIERKHALFEKFLDDKIRLSKPVTTSGEITSLPQMDAYIVGSDQIWNFAALDFDWAYYLDFIPDEYDGIRIAYAPSMGPAPSIETLPLTERDKVRNLLQQFDAISVREKKTAEIIKILGNFDKEPEVCPDPTLLLNNDEWEAVISPEKQSKIGEYIFLYNPYYLKEVYEQAHTLSRLTKLPVIVSNIAPKTIIPSISFEKRLETGPIEFLSLVKDAKYVIGRSFHLAVFAMIFNKQFIAVNGLTDSRVGNLLSQIGMTGCATEGNNVKDVLRQINNLDFTHCNRNLNDLRIKGRKYLENNLKPLL